jgi:hypothetical protein
MGTAQATFEVMLWGMRTPREPRKGSSDLRSHPVAMVLLLRKKRGKKPGMCRTYFRSGPLPDRASYSHVTDVTSVQNTLLGWIWGNFQCHVLYLGFTQVIWTHGIAVWQIRYIGVRQVIRAHITCLSCIFLSPSAQEIYSTDRLYEPPVMHAQNILPDNY